MFIFGTASTAILRHNKKYRLKKGNNFQEKSPNEVNFDASLKIKLNSAVVNVVLLREEYNLENMTLTCTSESLVK